MVGRELSVEGYSHRLVRLSKRLTQKAILCGRRPIL